MSSSSAVDRVALRLVQDCASSEFRQSSSKSNERPGDSWRKRYKSLCLHDPVWYDHLPYIPFPENWPVLTPKDKVGDWLEMYTKVMELNYWGSTTCKSAQYDETSGECTVIVDRAGKRSSCAQATGVATGMSGKPNIPKFPGQDIFKGEQQALLAASGPGRLSGKKVVVVGSNNSAHDICAALWEAAPMYTMLQRSSTHIVKSNSLMEIGWAISIRTRRRQWDDHAKSRSHLRLAPLQDHA